MADPASAPVDPRPRRRGVRRALALGRRRAQLAQRLRAAARPRGVRQVATLLRQHKLADAARVGTMITTPQAVWFTNGTPQRSSARCADHGPPAALERTVPPLVAYYLPFRDCAQYSPAAP